MSPGAPSRGSDLGLRQHLLQANLAGAQEEAPRGRIGPCPGAGRQGGLGAKAGAGPSQAKPLGSAAPPSAPPQHNLGPVLHQE